MDKDEVVTVGLNFLENVPFLLVLTPSLHFLKGQGPREEFCLRLYDAYLVSLALLLNHGCDQI